MQVNSYGGLALSYQSGSTPVNGERDGSVGTKEPKESEKKSLNELTPEQKEQVVKLQARDMEVRTHEAAHQAAGGGLAGGASFEYQKGADNRLYAVGGEVPITFKEGATPQESIANARQIRAAAMAPANPSAQDYAVASSATMMELKAQQELLKLKMQELEGSKAYSTQSAPLLKTSPS